MGVIKDGSISGILPSTKVFAVNYPGYPSSMERALVTLGGAEGIAKARQSPSSNLELRFRPEDPYSHPAFGELLPTNNFLLKISKHGVGQLETDAVTCLNEEEAQTSEGPEDKIYANIVGCVSETYYFNGMVDYQHVLAVHADVARKKKRSWADVEPQFEKHGLIDADQEDLMILLPPFFALKDIPENMVLKPSMYVSLKKKQEGVVQHRWEMDIDPSLAIDFNIKDVPKKVNWEKFIREGTDEWNCQMAVCKLFDERPIWIKQSLYEHLSSKGLKLGSNHLKRLLFRAAYYFANGPFLRFWIRKGYDPRKDPESRIYQRIDFRVPPSLRSYCDTGMASGAKHKWEDLCAFRVFPFKCQTSLQLFELNDDYIQQEIKKPSTQATCTLATGWFSAHILDILRLCVAVRFLSVYPNPGAESLVKSTSLRFEKSKRTKTVIEEQVVNEDEHQRVNRDQVLVEEKEMSNDEDDDDVEDDMEDENVDEDFDAYAGLDMAGDGTNFIPEPSYTNEENISKNYLQELFGVPVMLLRNIDQQNGLCNGTRLQVISMGDRVIEAEIISGSNIGKRTFIPIMCLTPSDKRIPFKVQRRQFTLAVCFAMMINKSQGQSLSKVGLFLKDPVFTHGQLYVALSRVKSRNGLKILVLDKEGKVSNRTSNVIYKEVFSNL